MFCCTFVVKSKCVIYLGLWEWPALIHDEYRKQPYSLSFSLVSDLLSFSKYAYYMQKYSSKYEYFVESVIPMSFNNSEYYISLN